MKDEFGFDFPKGDVEVFGDEILGNIGFYAFVEQEIEIEFSGDVPSDFGSVDFLSMGFETIDEELFGVGFLIGEFQTDFGVAAVEI